MNSSLYYTLYEIYLATEKVAKSVALHLKFFLLIRLPILVPHNLISRGVGYSSKALKNLLLYNDKRWHTVGNIFSEAYLALTTQLPEKLLSPWPKIKKDLTI